MKRQIDDYLRAWKDSKTRRPLLIRGARQVGKTYAVDAFGAADFTHYVKINFEQEAAFRELFQEENIGEICRSIELLKGVPLIEGQTLLFLDEIQACPEAIVRLRYFFEEKPGLHLVAAGSLLDFTLSTWKYSMPVGRVEFAYMYPMNFTEFLWGMGETALTEYLEAFQVGRDVMSRPVHEKLLKWVRYYYFIGGMPEAVRVFAETGSLLEVEKIHERILTSYALDFAKYGSRKQQEIMQHLLEYIPAVTGRKFKFSSVNPEAGWRSAQIREALELLGKSRLIHFVYASKASGIPLSKDKNQRVFKLLFLDIGLLNHQLKLRLLDVEELITNHEGALAEQFVGQQLIASGPWFMEKQLFYWLREKRKAEAEVDFLLDFTGELLPVEVKAGSSGRLRSLHVFMAEKKLPKALRYNADLPSAARVDIRIPIGGGMQRVEYELYSLPLYMGLNVLPKI